MRTSHVLAGAVAVFSFAYAACSTSSSDGSSRADQAPTVNDVLPDGAAATLLDGGPATLPDGAPASLPAGACVTDDDCPETPGADTYCVFAVGVACGATGYGTCAAAAAGCAETFVIDCACDGTAREQPCGLPAGFTRGATAHDGGCASGTVPCQTRADCPASQDCAYEVALGCAATGVCIDAPDPTVAQPGCLLEVCACNDAGAAIPCAGYGGGAYATAPVRSTTSNVCPAPDGGS